jgi:NADH-quinone oxidoreductase subunit K
MVPLGHYLALSGILFVVGVLGVLTRRNAIIVFLAVEIMLSAVNLSFVALSRFTGNLDGQVMVFFTITVAAAEAAVGLAIIVAMFRGRETVDISSFNVLKG